MTSPFNLVWCLNIQAIKKYKNILQTFYYRIFFSHNNMTSNITVVDIEEDKQQENEAVETIQEETNNEAVVEPVEQQPDEIVSAPPETKPEPKKKQPPIPLDQTVKQNAKQQDKLVKCPQCDKQMKLKSYRYKHEATCRGKLEDIPKKPKAMPKPKAQPIQQPIQVIEPKPTQPVQNQIIQPRNPLADITNHYQLLQQQFIQQKKEKYNVLCQNMFSTKSKKR